MAESKPLASLTSGLLARKGSALPAMRRQSIGGFGGGFGGNSGTGHSIAHDDLGWNDMGHDHGASADILPLAGLTPMAPMPVLAEPTPVPQVVTERAELAERVATSHVAPVAPDAVKVAAVGRKAAFTLRLDPQRHLKLRLLCAVQGRSAQQIVSEALDNFLKGQPEIDRLAEQLPPARGKN